MTIKVVFVDEADCEAVSEAEQEYVEGVKLKIGHGNVHI